MPALLKLGEDLIACDLRDKYIKVTAHELFPVLDKYRARSNIKCGIVVLGNQGLVFETYRAIVITF